MPIHELQADNQAQAARFSMDSRKPTSNRRVLAMVRRNGPAKEGLEEILSSALQSADNELGQILHEVDEISKTLKLDAPDTQTLRAAAQPTVWQQLKLASRQAQSLLLLHCDIDNLKKINDSYGHQDRWLRVCPWVADQLPFRLHHALHVLKSFEARNEAESASYCASTKRE